VASESTSLASYYAQREKRPDLVCVSLSDPTALSQMGEGDFVIVARGRRYFSNDAVISLLGGNAHADIQLKLGQVHSADVYLLSEKTAGIVRVAAQHISQVSTSR
jgi:hypothetical protein